MAYYPDNRWRNQKKKNIKTSDDIQTSQLSNVCQAELPWYKIGAFSETPYVRIAPPFASEVRAIYTRHR